MHPFTPIQRALISAAAVMAALWGAWNIARIFLPRWRGTPLEGYARAGMGVFLLVFAAESAGLARGWSFFTQNPKHILILPATGVAVCLFMLLPSAILAEKRKRALARRQPTPQSIASEAAVLRMAAIYSSVLAALVPGLLFSLYGQLFGPEWPSVFGIAGFLLAMAVFFLSRAPIGVRFVQVCPQGLSGRFTKLQRLQLPLRRARVAAGICAAIGLIALTASARLDGVPGTPVFAPRQQYFLANHGVLTAVSPLRYWIAGTAFHVAWHSGALYAMLLALHALFWGRLPKEPLAGAANSKET